MKYLPLLAIFCSIPFCETYCQEIATIDVHLFSNESKDLKFNFTYELDAEGENAVGKTIFENTIQLTQVVSSNDTMVINIEADSTWVSNQKTITDGDAALLYAMIGLNMKLKCNSKGELIEVLNKEELILEFKNGLTGMSNDRKDIIVQNMLAENESLLFEKMYEVNYAMLLMYMNKDLALPLDSQKDSLVEETAQIPKSTIKTIEKNTRGKDKISFRTTVIQQADEYSQIDSEYETINKPIVSTIDQLLTTDPSGLVQSLSINTEIKREGMIMKYKGKIMHEMKAFTQLSDIKYVRIK